jgi:hypothetical protein
MVGAAAWLTTALAFARPQAPDAHPSPGAPGPLAQAGQVSAPSPGTEAARATPATGPEADAEAAIAKGVALRQEGKDADALAYFRRAYQTFPSPRARAQIGLDEQALGMWLEAEADLAAALAPASADDPWVKRYRQPLESALAIVRGRLGSLEIVSNVPAAEVIVDGARVGTGPGPFRVVAGERTVVVQAAAYHSVSRTVGIPGGGIARETFELVPAAAAPPLDSDERRDPTSAARDATEERTAQRRLGWVLLGGSVAVLAGGGVAQIVREIGVARYNDSTCPGVAVTSQPADCSDRISSAATWQTLAVVGFATGGALAATGAILLWTAPPGSAPAGSRARAVRTRARAVGAALPALGGAGVTCEGRF